MGRFRNRSGFFLAATTLTLLCLATNEVASQQCTYSWESCRQIGMKEVQKEKLGSQVKYLCCPPNDQESIKYFTEKAQGCQDTKCMPEGTSNPCQTGTEYFAELTVNRKTMRDYISTAKASCDLKSGEKGVVHNCCPKNHDGVYLASTLGAENREFPHQVNQMGCGGTVYNKRWVVTAAHCVVDGNTGRVKKNTINDKLYVNLGSDLFEFTKPSRTYEVIEVITHPKYSGHRNHTEFRTKEKDYRGTWNDIAIMKVDRDIEYDDQVRPLRIAPQDFNPSEYDDRLVIIGWGKTDTGSGSTFLQKAATPIRTEEQCFGDGVNAPSVLESTRRKREIQYRQMTAEEFMRLLSGGGSTSGNVVYKSPFQKPSKGSSRNRNRNFVPWQELGKIKDGVICIGGIINGTWGSISWSGDSGGPAICRGENGKAVLCGVSSFGGGDRDKCSKESIQEYCKPSFYARVPRWSNWIQGIAGPQEEGEIFEPYLFGRDTKKGEYSHQVHITTSNGRPCGGTLVKANKVITAAQCVFDAKKNRLEDLQVTAHKHNIKDKGTTYEVASVDLHDEFKLVKLPFKNKKTDQFTRNALEQEVFGNDIAIITLKKSVKNVKSFPAIPKESNEPAASTGEELSFRRDPKYSSVLQSRDFKLLSQADCQERLERMKAAGITMKIHESIICAVEKYSGGSSCDRELGGGVICKDKRGKEILCGVQVIRLCYSSFPNGFLNTGYYNSWINQRI